MSHSRQAAPVVREEHRVVAAEFSGPLPLPEHLARYDEILPGSAERMLKMAESQALHRQRIESAVIDSGAQNSRLGLVFAFIICMTCLAISAWGMYVGNGIAGAVVGALGLGSIVGAFIYGTNSNRKEREWKSQDMR